MLTKHGRGKWKLETVTETHFASRTRWSGAHRAEKLLLAMSEILVLFAREKKSVSGDCQL